MPFLGLIVYSALVLTLVDLEHALWNTKAPIIIMENRGCEWSVGKRKVIVR